MDLAAGSKRQPATASRIERGLGAAGLLLVLLVTAHATVQTRADKWDFRAYYYAALAPRLGLNPYSARHIEHASGRRDVPGYKYPPLLLTGFAPLTLLPFDSAQRVWVGLSCLALVALGWIVARRVLGRLLDPYLWGLVLFTHPYILRITIASGNLELFVQLAVWAAVAALLTSRAETFAGRTVLATLPKAIAASYAAVPFALGWSGVRPALLVIAAGGAWFGVNALLEPELTRLWLLVAADTVRPASEPAWGSPSLFWLVSALHGDSESTRCIVTLLSVAVAGSAGAVLVGAKQAPARGRVLFALLTVTLLWPRLKDYSYFAFVPPAAWLMRDLFEHGAVRRWLAGVGVTLLVAGRGLWTPVPVDYPATVADIAVAYLPWLLALALWLAFAAHLASHESKRAPRPVDDPAPTTGSEPHQPAPGSDSGAIEARVSLATDPRRIDVPD